MPVRAKVDLLPDDIRAELIERIGESAYACWVDHSEWLAERGYVIKKSALANYGKRLQAIEAAAEERLQTVRAATDAALMMSREIQDDEAQLSAAVISMIQSDMFQVMVNLQEATEESNPTERMELLSKAARAAADAGRASVSLKKFGAEMRAKLDAKLAKMENEAQAGSAGPRKLDAETLRIVRQEVYGLV